jgi:hypothetical protein
MKVLPNIKTTKRIYFDIAFVLFCLLGCYIGQLNFFYSVLFAVLVYYICYFVINDAIEIHIEDNKLIVRYIYKHFCKDDYYDMNKISKVRICTYSETRFGPYIQIYTNNKLKGVHFYRFSHSEWEKLIVLLKERKICYETVPKDYFD